MMINSVVVIKFDTIDMKVKKVLHRNSGFLDLLNTAKYVAYRMHNL